MTQLIRSKYMKIEVLAHSQRDYASAAVSIEVPEMFEQAFDRVDICDDFNLLAASCGGISNAEMKVVTKLREGAAKDMSEYIAKLLIQHMTKDDTVNGYAV
jgi:hypothetical protein